MAAMTDISKGSFYNSYSQMLFFAVLEEYQSDVMSRLDRTIGMETKIDKSSGTVTLWFLSRFSLFIYVYHI